MRIRRIELLAFGPFTSRHIDFGAKGGRLHLVQGPNEAGKSSLLRAIRGLLFGIPSRTLDNFLHENKALRVGGELENAQGDRIAFVRRKGTKKDLLNPDDNSALPDACLFPFVSSTDGESFERIWGIDHQKLIAGGIELKELKGLAGESLFATAMGVSGLSQTLAGLEKDAREIFAPDRRSKTAIRETVTRYNEALKSKRIAEVSASKWLQLRKELKRAGEDREKVRERLDGLRAEGNRLSRILSALGEIGERRVAKEHLESLANVDVLSADYSVDERRDSEQKLSAATSSRARAQEELNGKDGLLARCLAVKIDRALLEHEVAVSAVQQGVGDYKETCASLPKREAEKHVLIEQAKRLLHELDPSLGWDDAEKLRLPQSAEAEIVRVGQRQGSLKQSLTGFEDQIVELQSEVSGEQQALVALAAPLDTGVVRRVVRAARKEGDLQRVVVDLLASGEALSQRVSEQFARLGLFSGDLEEIGTVELPLRATLENYVEKFRANRDDSQRLDDRSRDLLKEVAELSAQMEADRKKHHIPTQQELNAQRGHREKGWQLVRGAWLEGNGIEESSEYSGKKHLSEAYEAATKLADNTADQLVADSELSAIVEQQKGQLEAREQALLKLKPQREALVLSLQGFRSEWKQLWAKSKVESPLSPREMLEWCEVFTGVRDLAQQHWAAVEEASKKSELLSQHREKLIECLATVNKVSGEGNSSFDDVLSRCEDLLEAATAVTQKRDRLRQSVAEKERKLGVLRGKVERAQGALSDWEEEWSAALTGLGEGVKLSVAMADARVRLLRELFKNRDAIVELDTGRIVPMKAKKQQFERETRQLVERCAPGLAEQASALAATSLAQRLRDAQKSLSDREHLEEKIDAKRQELQSIDGEIEEATDSLKRLCRLAEVDKPEALSDRERNSEIKNKLLDRLEMVDRRLSKVGEGMSVEDLLDETSGKSSDDLKVEHKNLKEKIESCEMERDSLTSEVATLRGERDVVDADGPRQQEGSDADEQALGCLAEISQHAEQYLRLRFASNLLRLRIEKHRAENQDPMISRASELFARLTCGAFDGLTLDYNDKDEPTIVGLRVGESQGLPVEAFSKGTADQLYLALRLAYLKSRAEKGEAMPLILDDILVDFDDDRASATLKVLAEVAQEMQVIVFSHHSHLTELARQSIGKEGLVEHQLHCQ